MSNLAHRLRRQNNISSELIMPVEYGLRVIEDETLLAHTFETIEDNFCEKINKGDFLVAGENFGCGNANEAAPVVLKKCGLQAVIAKNFSRIFYRCALNYGLCLIECETNYIDDMDEIELDLAQNIVKNISKGVYIDIKPIPKMMKVFLNCGGVFEYFKSQGNLDNVLV